MKILNQGLDIFIRLLNIFLPNKNIVQSKKDWNKLALENHRYYIVSKKGQGINEDDFRQSGRENYQHLVKEDPLLQELLGNVKDKRVLEIGCGVGRMTEFFAADFKEIYGVDIAEKMIELGRLRLGHLTNLYLKATNGVHYPFDDSYFDLVFSYIVFQHMPSRAVVKANLTEILRVLKPEGVVKIQLRGGSQPAKWQWYYGPVFSYQRAKELVESVGFKILKTADANKKRFWLWLKK